MNEVMSLAGFVEYFFILVAIMKGTRTMKVVMDKDITTSIGTSNIELGCQLQPATGDKVLEIRIFARNKTTDDYSQIAVFYPSSKNKSAKLTSVGQYLAGRVSLTNPTDTLNTAILSFNEIQCEDNTDYKCKVWWHDNDDLLKDEFSTSTKVTITSKPAKPDYIVPSVQLSDVEDGQNVSFICIGNLGKPALGKLVWRKQKDGNVIDTFYNVSTEIEKIPENCTFRGTSNLTLQITKNDTGAVIECTEDATEKSMWLQTQEINVKLPSDSTTMLNQDSNMKFDTILYVIVSVIGAIVVIAVVVVVRYACQKKERRRSINKIVNEESEHETETVKKQVQVTLSSDYGTVHDATDKPLSNSISLLKTEGSQYCEVDLTVDKLSKPGNTTNRNLFNNEMSTDQIKVVKSPASSAIYASVNKRPTSDNTSDTISPDSGHMTNKDSNHTQDSTQVSQKNKNALDPTKQEVKILSSSNSDNAGIPGVDLKSHEKQVLNLEPKAKNQSSSSNGDQSVPTILSPVEKVSSL